MNSGLPSVAAKTLSRQGGAGVAAQQGGQQLAIFAFAEVAQLEVEETRSSPSRPRISRASGWRRPTSVLPVGAEQEGGRWREAAEEVEQQRQRGVGRVHLLEQQHASAGRRPARRAPGRPARRRAPGRRPCGSPRGSRAAAISGTSASAGNSSTSPLATSFQSKAGRKSRRAAAFEQHLAEGLEGIAALGIGEAAVQHQGAAFFGAPGSARAAAGFAAAGIAAEDRQLAFAAQAGVQPRFELGELALAAEKQRLGRRFRLDSPLPSSAGGWRMGAGAGDARPQQGADGRGQLAAARKTLGGIFGQASFDHGDQPRVEFVAVERRRSAG